MKFKYATLNAAAQLFLLGFVTLLCVSIGAGMLGRLLVAYF